MDEVVAVDGHTLPRPEVREFRIAKPFANLGKEVSVDRKSIRICDVRNQKGEKKI